MINGFLSIFKLTFSMVPLFFILVSFISLVYPQYHRFQQDQYMKVTAGELLKKIHSKKQKERMQETIGRNELGSKKQLIKILKEFPLQKARLERLQQSQNHIAAAQNDLIQHKIAEIKQSPYIHLTIQENNPYEYCLSIDKSYQLEGADLLFLFHLLNQPNFFVKQIVFNKQKDFDQEVFLLTRLEIVVYEEKN